MVWLCGLVGLILTDGAGPGGQGINGGIAQSNKDSADLLLSVMQAKNEPVSVVAMQREDTGTDKGNLVVRLKNVASRSIRFLSYTFVSPRCPKSPPKTAGRGIFFGDSAYLSKANAKLTKNEPPVPPGERFSIVVPSAWLVGAKKGARMYGCADDVRPTLYLTHVIFTDGTGWEGFANGSNHDQWDGRPWTPPPVQPEKGRQPKK
jgi:hypothetical protein